MTVEPLTIVVLVNDEPVLRRNLLKSPGIAQGRHQIILQRAACSASLGLNDAIARAEHDLMLFVHQDLYLPEGWFDELDAAVAYCDADAADWGVLGCFGSRADAHGGLGQIYTHGLGPHGRRLVRPELAETLDEIVLVIRRSSGLRFDPTLPHFHLYGADLCVAARARGLQNYAFQGFCIHNTNQLITLPTEFYACCNYLRRKWTNQLPIRASCMTITRWNGAVHRRRISDGIARTLRSQAIGFTRGHDPCALVEVREKTVRMPQPRIGDHRYAVITPVRDEVAFIGKTIEAMRRQSLPPVRWIVVDDGSTDGTAALLDTAASHLPWITIIHRKDRGRRSAGGGVMEAFSAGYAVLPADSWEYLVKLDGDLSFAPDYFARCLGHFDADPQLGIGGGTVCQWSHGGAVIDSKGDPTFHVRGATKIYRRACWETISPLLAAPGWDTMDEVKANYYGWRTRTFVDITLIQHKPTGGADGMWRNAFKNGRANYITGYHPAFMLAKCLKRAVQKPLSIGSLALLFGFVSGYLKRVPRAADAAVIAYLRDQQVRRLRKRPSIYA